MSKRRSTRLSNTPKINYEEKQIELRPSTTISSKKKKRDDHHDLKNNKKFKKIKLKHEAKNDLLIDDDETIISSFSSNSDFNYDAESNNLIYQNTSFNESLDASIRYELNNGDSSNFSDLNNKKLIDNKSSSNNDNLNRSVDSEGFLIQNDNTKLDELSTTSSYNNQSIIDVTDYDKFSDLDGSTSVNNFNGNNKQNRNEINNDDNKILNNILDENKSDNQIDSLFIKAKLITTKSTSKKIGTSILEQTKSTENKVIIIDSTDEEIIEIKDNKLNENSIIKITEFKNLSSNSSSSIELNKDDDFISLKSDDTWTIKYKPLNSDQILDNKEVSKQIKDWIDDFNSTNNKMYYDEFNDGCLESCVLITGPTGCGKTAMVYAIAEELNYKVFEINCSSRRNSKFINQIKEATLSHTVTRQSNSPQKTPTKKPPIDSKQKTLFNFFQKKKSTQSLNHDQIIDKPSILINSPIIDETSFSQETVNNLNSLSINSNSLILVDDVDIIFDEDTGFWQSLQLLIENTKRPIILTATNLIKSIRQEIKRPLCVKMNYPKITTLKNYLQNIVVKECVQNDDLINDKNDKNNKINIPINYSNNIELYINDNHCDIRSCLNRLQFDFSSVNILKEQLIDNSIELDNNKNSVNIEDKLINNSDLKNYNNLILSDLLENNFQINSRNELDNSCFMDESYQIKNLKDSISIEFNSRLNDILKIYKQKNLNKNLNWLNDFNQSKLEIDKYLIHLASKDNLFCDYLPYLSSIMNLEEERLKLFLEHTRRARRFLPYLDSLYFYLSDSAKKFLTNNYLIHKRSLKDS